MSNSVSLEEVEQMAEQLTLPDRLKLISHIRERLSKDEDVALRGESAEAERLRDVEAWLAACDAVAESVPGEFDSAEDLRRIRDERASRL